MISKQKTTLKEYGNSKGREQLLIQGQGEDTRRKEKRTTPPLKPVTLTQVKNSNLVGEGVVVGTGKQNSKRYWAESCQPGC